jgi:hypothetical protein
MSNSSSDKAILRSGRQLQEHIKSKSVDRNKSKHTDQTPKLDKAKSIPNICVESQIPIPIRIKHRQAVATAECTKMSDEKDKEIQLLQSQLKTARDTLAKEQAENEEMKRYYEIRFDGEEVARKAPTPIIIDSAASVPIPRFDANKMTPEAFLIEVEEYLAWKNASEETYVFLVSRMFAKDSDISRWWRETKQSVKTWDEFKLAFLNYEKSGASRDELLAKLFSTRQKLTDAFETFAWDVNGIYRKIDSKIAVTEVIQRILNSCLPEISVILRNSTYNSVADLIFKAREVIHDLNKVRNLEGKTAFRSKSTDPLESKPYHGRQGNDRRSRGWRRQDDYAKSREQDKEAGSEEEKQGNSNSKADIPQQQQQPKQDSGSQPRAGAGSSGYLHKRRPISCFYCNVLGHKEADCNTKKRDERLGVQKDTRKENQGN